MPDQFTLVETGLYTALTTCGGTAIWGTRVFANQGTAKAPLPYVIFFPVSFRDDNDRPTRAISMAYQVEGWASSDATASAMAGSIDDALHNKRITVTGYTNYLIRNVEQIATLENEGGAQYFRRGAVFVIHISK